jgi:ferrochelatase
LLKEELGWADTDIRVTFQSKFGPEQWIEPYTVEEVARLAKAGKKNIAVIAPAFASDCVETLEEINEEIKESFEAAGGKSFTYIPCLNDSDAHIDVLTSALKQEMSGWV